jgi:hypothetical protein
MAVCIFLLTGCANNFSKYYVDNMHGVTVAGHPLLIASEGEPKALLGRNEESETLTMFEDGYNLIGYSSFTAGDVNRDDAISQGTKLNASVVILYRKHIETTTGVIPMTLPDTRTSSTNISGNIYGGSGISSYRGTATTTTYGTQTTMIPYSASRYDYLATYWAKIRVVFFGVHARDMAAEHRQKHRSNNGVLAYAVIKGSPAYKADIINGDILLKIGDIDVNDAQAYSEAIDRYKGLEVNVVGMNNGNLYTKKVKLHSDGGR